MIYFQSQVSFRFGWPREASRLEARTHEAEAKPHEAEAEAEATTHEAEAEAEARFFGLEAEARPRGLTSLNKASHATQATQIYSRYSNYARPTRATQITQARVLYVIPPYCLETGSRVLNFDLNKITRPDRLIFILYRVLCGIFGVGFIVIHKSIVLFFRGHETLKKLLQMK